MAVYATPRRTALDVILVVNHAWIWPGDSRTATSLDAEAVKWLCVKRRALLLSGLLQCFMTAARKRYRRPEDDKVIAQLHGPISYTSPATASSSFIVWFLIRNMRLRCCRSNSSDLSHRTSLLTHELARDARDVLTHEY